MKENFQPNFSSKIPFYAKETNAKRSKKVPRKFQPLSKTFCFFSSFPLLKFSSYGASLVILQFWDKTQQAAVGSNPGFDNQ